MYKQNKMLKNKDYANNPQTTEETKNFWWVVSSTSKDVLHRVFGNVFKNIKLACNQKNFFSKILSDLKQNRSLKENIVARNIRRSLLLAGRTTHTFSATELRLSGARYSRLTQRHLIKLCSYLFIQSSTHW